MHSRALVGWKIERSTRRAALRSVLIDSDAARLTGQAVLRVVSGRNAALGASFVAGIGRTGGASTDSSIDFAGSAALIF
jgi:hypothetical protein